jgi:hypothetical protein
MKKIFVLVLALFLAVPAISYAGSATSRWDLSVGGTLKFDFGYVNQNQGSDYFSSLREPNGGFDSADYDYGNLIAGAAETSLSFFVKGPDAWGAKTSAFILGDFSGLWAGTTYGTFNLLAATVALDWANTTLTMGAGGGVIFNSPTFAGNLLSFGGLNFFAKGSPVVPQITLTQRFGKAWTAKFGIMAPGNRQGQVAGPNAPLAAVFPIGSGGNSSINNFTRWGYPQVQGDISWSSPACGKVGPFQLLVGAGGLWGKEKRIFNGTTLVGPAQPYTTTLGVVAANLDDDTYDVWMATFRWVVPIIPEKQGNKTGALLTDGIVFTGQNGDGHGPGPSTAFGNSLYLRTSGTTDYVAPVFGGGQGHIGFYITNALGLHGFYGYYKLNQSKARDAAAPNNIETNQHIFVTLMYDLNPALRIGAEYGNIRTKYAGTATNQKDKGTLQELRVGAFYFF